MTSAAIVGVLVKHISEKRLTRLSTVLRSRVRDTTLVFENLGDPHNIAACLRTADALGIQDGEKGMGRGVEMELGNAFTQPAVHIIERWNEHFFPSQQTSQGASKWLTLHRHASVREWCVVSEGSFLVSSRPHPGACAPLQRKLTSIRWLCSLCDRPRRRGCESEPCHINSHNAASFIQQLDCIADVAASPCCLVLWQRAPRCLCCPAK